MFQIHLRQVMEISRQKKQEVLVLLFLNKYTTVLQVLKKAGLQ